MTLTDPNQALRPNFIEVSAAFVSGLVQLIITEVGVPGLA